MAENKSGATAHHRSSEATVSLMEGLSKTALAKLFRIDKKTVGVRLAGVKPVGERNSYPVYDIADAASVLAAPTDEQVVRLIEQMPPHKLPVKIRKEFWDSALSRQKYEEKAGDLWRTEEIYDALTEVFKIIRSSVNLFSDKVDREVGLDEAQRALIIDMSDELLIETARKLVSSEEFAKFENSLIQGEDGSDGIDSIATKSLQQGVLSDE